MGPQQQGRTNNSPSQAPQYGLWFFSRNLESLEDYILLWLCLSWTGLNQGGRTGREHAGSIINSSRQWTGWWRHIPLLVPKGKEWGQDSRRGVSIRHPLDQFDFASVTPLGLVFFLHGELHKEGPEKAVQNFLDAQALDLDTTMIWMRMRTQARTALQGVAQPIKLLHLQYLQAKLNGIKRF